MLDCCVFLFVTFAFLLRFRFSSFLLLWLCMEGMVVGRRKEEKEEKRNLSKKRKRHKKNTAVKHWSPLSSYCLVL